VIALLRFCCAYFTSQGVRFHQHEAVF
jgi:hypothetical protein